MSFSLILTLVFMLFSRAYAQDSISALSTKDICPDRSGSIKCLPSANTNFTPIAIEALYGISTVDNDLCEYNDGDCYGEATSNFCQSPFSDCTIYASSSFKISKCQNQLADYLHIRYRCIPYSSSVIKENKICESSTGDITELNGFLSSPNYPTYTIQSTECIRKIQVPNNKVINMWLINDFKSPGSDNDCKEDYLKITDNTGTYTTCGYRKYSFENKFCSSVLYITYKAPTSLSSLYRGFKLYYEAVDRSTQSDCPTNTPIQPTAPTTITTTLPLITNLTASVTKKEYICRGKDLTIDIPSKFTLFPISYYYGVTSDFTCNTIGPQNCKSPAQFTCTTQGSCKISLATNVVLNDCDGKTANYIGIEYKFIPLTTVSNFTVCDSTDVNATLTTSGIMTSVNYPNWQNNQNCQRSIVAKHGRIIRVYISDLSIEPSNINNNCQNGYLRLVSECDNVTYCGDKSSGGLFVYDSCSSILTVSYVSSSISDAGYRGFNLYYEVMPEEKASVLIRKTVCAGSSVSITCPSSLTTNFTAFAIDVVYGVKSNATTGAGNTCVYNGGDCFDTDGSSFCANPVLPTCSVFSSFSQIISGCISTRADYFSVNYRCIPALSSSINNYNICDKSLLSITDANAFISSPNYPTYTIVADECTQKIVAPKDKIIRMWISADMKGTNSQNECAADYIQIIDNTGVYKVCGYRKHSFENKFCSSVLYVSYKAPAELSSIYRGMRIYYEFIDRSSQPDCPTETPTTPPTTIPTTTTKPLIFDLAAYAFNRTYVCRGSNVTINIPNNYYLFPIDVYYAATQSQQCTNFSINDCKAATTLDCSFQGSCTVSFLNDYYLQYCGGIAANYISIEYRFIPYTTAKNYSACSNDDIMVNKTAYGIITSTNYPTWTANENCLRRIIAPQGYVVRTYLYDYSIEEFDEIGQNCSNGYLRLLSDYGDNIYCGSKSKYGVYQIQTRNNVLTIQYKTSSVFDDQYRGFNLYFEIVSSNAENLLTQDICPGASIDLKCDRDAKTNYTVFVSEAIYGIKSSSLVAGCQFTSGDCYDVSSSTFCTSTIETCSIFSSSTQTVNNCGNKKSDYFHVRYRCIPAASTLIRAYDVCDTRLTNGLFETAAFIRSPNYPRYTIVPYDCIIRIVAPSNKAIRLWSALDMKSSDTNNQCSTDYLMITDSIATYKTCGYKKVSLDKQLCSSIIYVSYRAPANLSATLYKGFQLYYEFIDRSSDCPTNTPMPPTTLPPITTTTTLKPFSNNTATDINKLYICKGTQKDIIVPSGYSLVIINSYYGTTPDYTCNTINPQNCKSPATLTCSSQGPCTVSLYNSIELDDCNGLIAHYIGVEYRFVPLYSATNFTVCDFGDLNVTTSGIITSNGYPNFIPSQTCRRKLVAPPGKFIRVFVTDLSIELPEANNECQNGFLKFSSTCDDITHCGSKTNEGSYIFESCSNILTISYTSSANSSPNFKGFNVYYEITGSEQASYPLQEDVCAGVTKIINCDSTPYTKSTVIVNEAIYGIKNQTTNQCGLTVGDCYQTSKTSFCTTLSDTCSAYASTLQYVAKCDDKLASYLHLRYRCIPYQSSIIRDYNICDKSLLSITDQKGFISSPNYPTFLSVNEECVQKIVVPDDKIINIWIPHIYIKDSESNNDCVTDYVKITHNTGTFKACGSKKFTFENRLCSSVVYISYKAPTTGSLYKGFKLYYEVLSRATQPNCPTGTPTPPFNVNVTTIKPEILDLQATNIEKLYVCYGEMKVLNKKSNYVLFPLDFYYGITQDGTCQSFSDKDCKAPAPFSCASDDDCQISLYNQVNVDDCSGNVASYIGMEYRYIPFYSSKNYSICSNNTESIIIDGSLLKYGVITSPYYPKWIPNERCRLRIDAPLDKLIRVYITDLSTEPEDEDSGNCTKSYLSLNTGYINTRYCGDKSNEIGNYVFISCSNSLDIVYHSSSIASSSYRGFNLYYEVIDKTNNNIQCPNISTSTRSTRTTRHVTLINDNQKHSSNKLIGWSLGIGIPVIIIIIILFFMLLKRTSTQNGNLAFNFQKMHNSDLE